MSRFEKADGKFDKDAWILSAIAAGYIMPQEDGTVYRRSSASEDGKRMSSQVRLVTPRVHKKSGRVYFNMTWLGATKSVLLNRVIALKFLPNPLKLPQVNHIDGDKEHNYLRQPTPELIAKWGEYQLEWSTGQDNERHAHRTGLKSGRGSQNSNVKLTSSQVIAIRERHTGGTKVGDLAGEFNVARSTIANIVSGKTWTHV